MKRIPLFLSILIVLSLSACVLPVPGGKAPSATIPETEAPSLGEAAPTEALVPTQPPPPTATVPLPTEPLPTAQPLAPTPVPPTAVPQAAVSQPTATQPPPTATSTPVITFDPYTALGDPKYQNEMRFPNYGEWAQAETKQLPNDENIRLQFKDGELYVTGKRLDFSTWWFSYHNLSDAYVEMTFNSEDCSGGDAYGMILRGPKHQAGLSYGYVVSFTCDGNIWAFRLDDVDPWDAEVLIEEERQVAIKTGPDQQNVIGVRLEGEMLTIFANGIQAAEIEDDHFEKGRVGVFVRAARPGAYTYRVTNFAYWLLGEED